MDKPTVCIFSSVHSALDNRVFYREAHSLSKAGYEVVLIAIHEKSEYRDGIQIIGLPSVSRWIRPVNWLRLFREAISTNADIYHFHDPELLLVSPWIKLFTKKPIIYDIHEAYPDFIKVKDYLPAWFRYPFAWIFRYLEPLLARLQDGLIFSDDEISAAFQNISLPKVTMFNFPSIEFVENAIEHSGKIEKREPCVIYLGGMERNRGTRLMVEAFEYVHQNNPDAMLLMVGHFMPPDLRSEVDADVRDRDLQKAVIITGRVPFLSIGEYLSKSSIGWLPWQSFEKNEKNIPTKLFEYMAYGLPIVSSSLRSTRPFIEEGINGFLVKPASPIEHADAIIRLLNDSALRLKMGVNGQEMVRTKYNWMEMEGKLLGFYSDVIRSD